MKGNNDIVMEIAEYLQKGQDVDLESVHDEEVKDSCRAIVEEAAGDSLSVVLNGACGFNLKNGDAVVVTGNSGSLTTRMDARVIGNIAENKVKMRVTGKKRWEDAGGEFRVYASVPFDYMKVPFEEYERYKESYRTVSGDEFLADPLHRSDFVDRGEVEPALYNCLIDIEQKLNLIIQHLSLQGSGRTVIPEERDVEISASGMRFDAVKELIAGDILKIRMLLPTFPISFLTFYSEVVKVLPLSDGRHETYITYLGLNTDLKDRITAYLFKRQREAIRNEKG